MVMVQVKKNLVSQSILLAYGHRLLAVAVSALREKAKPSWIETKGLI